MNPRYAAYMNANGQTSKDEMIRIDRAKYPGGVMTGYIIWVNEHWAQWSRETGGPTAGRSTADHENFDAWLDELFPASACAEAA